MEIFVGDKLLMKKSHPCDKSAKIFLVLRTGMDIKIRCENCGREVMLPRTKVEKNIKKIIRNQGD